MPFTKKSIYSFNDSNKDVHSIVPPSICPMCSHAISPVFVALALNSNEEGSIMFYCKACSNSFISYFNYFESFSDGLLYFKQFFRHEPKRFVAIKFVKIISNLSERFVQIYNQAAHAESLGLFEVAGPGYRKSLEILVKDYAIKKYPEKKELIGSATYTLSQCINEFIDVDRIKNPSIAASWLGNDATHYTKRHQNKDLSDLKQFIETVIFFIQFDLSADSAAGFVAEK